MQRRAFIEGVLASGAVATVGEAAAAKPKRIAAATVARPESEPETKAEPTAEVTPPEPTEVEHVWALLAPLTQGARIGLGWAVLGLTGVSRGAAVLTLVNETGEQARVHLCRRSPDSRPIAHSETVDLFLMNSGDGSVGTDETLGRVLNVLSSVLRHNEKNGAGASEAMLSHEARLAFFRSERALV